jgi:hypothetical protein
MIDATMDDRRRIGDMTSAPQLPQIAADVLLIGYPKAATTFVTRYLQGHPDATVDEHRLAALLFPEGGVTEVVAKPVADKVHVSRDENVAESVCWVKWRDNWERYLYVPGAWDRVRDDLVLDPREAAVRIRRVHSRAKVLLIIREQADWLQSVYKYVMSQLPWNRRSFADYCETPSGIAQLEAGKYDRTIEAYVEVFGSSSVKVLRFEDIRKAPDRFAAELCEFIGIALRPMPQHRENETNAQLARLQRAFPLVERLPRGLKNAWTPVAARLVPGGRGSVISSDEIRLLRAMYAASNDRTARLIDLLATNSAATGR